MENRCAVVKLFPREDLPVKNVTAVLERIIGEGFPLGRFERMDVPVNGLTGETLVKYHPNDGNADPVELSEICEYFHFNGFEKVIFPEGYRL